MSILKRLIGGKLKKLDSENSLAGLGFMMGLFPFGNLKKEGNFTGITYAAIDLRAKVVARAKFRIYQILNSDEFYEVDSNDEAYKFFDRLNPTEVNYQVLYRTVASLDLTGNAYWYLVKNLNGKPTEVWVIPPNLVEIVPKNAISVDHYRVYLNGQVIALKPDEVIHFKYPDPESFLYGKGPLHAVLTSVSADIYMRQYWEKIFENAGVPPRIVYEAEKGVTVQTIEKFRSDLKAITGEGGVLLAPVVLPGGIRVRPVSLNPVELDWIKSREVTREDILVAFGVPRSKLGLESGVNKAVAEASDFTFKSDVIEPILTLFDQTLTRFLIQPYFNESYVVMHDSVVPRDRELQLREYQIGINYGWLNVNEIRKREGYRPVEGGNIHYIPVNLAPFASYEEPQQAGNDSQRMQKRGINQVDKRDIQWRRISAFAGRIEQNLEVAIRKVLREQMNDLIDKLLTQKRGLQDILEININEWEKKMRDELTKRYGELIWYALEHWAKTYGVELNIERNDIRILEILEGLNSHIRDINETTLKQLNKFLADELKDFVWSEEQINKLIDGIRNYYNAVAFQRARTIAITSATAAVNGSLVIVLEEGGYKKKVWLSQRDGKVRESHRLADGQSVDIGESFVLTGRKGTVQLRYPGDPQAPAEEVVNCRCYIAVQD